jgi:hypothetical protein
VRGVQVKCLNPVASTTCTARPPRSQHKKDTRSAGSSWTTRANTSDTHMRPCFDPVSALYAHQTCGICCSCCAMGAVLCLRSLFGAARV